MLNKSIIEEIVSLSKIFAEGQENGTISKETYTSNFKETYLKPFEVKHKKSPNLILQEELRSFFNSELSGTDDKILYRSFGYWGNNIYSYVWACIYFDFGLKDLPASSSPQLYIVINKMGIKFGFCYGNRISINDDLVNKGKSELGLSLINEIIQKDGDISFFNSSQEDITARPEVLFGKSERILINNLKVIKENWTNKSLLIKEYAVNDIPDNISDVIQKTFLSLKPFYLSLLPIKVKDNSEVFTYDSFYKATFIASLKLSKKLVSRFVSSLLTKPFVILTGLSGSGKTKLAQAFATWICENENQYCLVPVGADWTNREPLLGFPNALESGKYIKPDNGVLDLLIEANKNAEKPYFLILDEMNLSHVERYFADFLSVMESDKNILLHAGTKSWDDVPAKIGIPKNLFIVGTVNVDETTYMFSPKVLDRANVIEFRVTKEEMKNFLSNGNHLDLESIKSKGSNMALDFVKTAKDKVSAENNEELQDTLLDFFTALKKTGAEFGYRSAAEIMRFSAVVKKLDSSWDKSEIIDAAIMQKLLPKVHGSRRKLEPVLKTLGNLCLNNGHKIDEYISPKIEINFDDKEVIKYPVSLEKIIRMYHGLFDNGFTSYAEA